MLQNKYFNTIESSFMFVSSRQHSQSLNLIPRVSDFYYHNRIYIHVNESLQRDH